MDNPISATDAVPVGWHTVSPRLVAHDAQQLVEFLGQVFGAKGEYRKDAPSVVRIGDSVVMVSDAGVREPMTAFLYVYVGDVDATYRRAFDAGAHSRRATRRARWRSPLHGEGSMGKHLANRHASRQGVTPRVSDPIAG
jgi:hypothetical protein